MQGKILSYDNERETGLISGEDDNFYSMSLVDCNSSIKPKAGAEVKFEPIGDKATEIYVVSKEVEEEVHISKHDTRKKSKSILLPLLIIASIVIFIAVLVYSEIDRRNMEKVQNIYDLQIKKIETYIAQGNCSEAASEYTRAQETRNKRSKMGLYYSLESHAKQAHAIEIAECYANNKDFDTAINMLDIKGIQDPDYLLRASIIYKNSGDISKGEEAKAMADKFDTSK